jgi:hypothetical protein
MLYVQVYLYAAMVQHVFLHTKISTLHVAGTGMLSIIYWGNKKDSYLRKKETFLPYSEYPQVSHHATEHHFVQLTFIKKNSLGFCYLQLTLWSF